MRAVPRTDSDNVDSFVRFFNRWAASFGVVTPLRTAHFLAQVFHESACLRRTEENLNYSSEGLVRTWPSRFSFAEAKVYAHRPEKIANRVYADRMGNGNEASGDGFRFRGRGLIMITGRDNYQAYADCELCNGNPVRNPWLLAKAPGSIKSALFFWQRNGCNQLADRDNAVAITRRINGSTLGLKKRLELLAVFKAMLGIK